MTGAGGGMFAPAGKAGFLIVTGAMGVAVFGDSMGFCTGLGAGAGTAGLMGLTAADAGVCGSACGSGSGAARGDWLTGAGAVFVPSGALVALGCGAFAAGCGRGFEGLAVAAVGV